ncbi:MULTISPECIES: pseudaminic acid cytidylyltransferase [Sphingobium]|uniref:Pseudaminic acid cytidylyltransferase n=1 Tax=Sphingobium chungbukense TaxID=56193 RepID=A0A0M3AKD3_9SPHN|nr:MULTISPECIES: pseudaminic acid cytidylyltransferase [Sphingobium]AMK26077.1 acylneuraminate cytidylyltransferase [Sphingobium sp. TKS]KKW90557.1 hypothetical protein YP76_18355 [Sphingobium chungbukense]
MTLCVIPARGGSKRIPRKNIRTFLGKPMIAWSISAAIEAQCFDRIVVSTDDAEIAELAAQMGVEVPFLRCAELSDDKTPTARVIADAATRLAIPPATPVCCLYATAPFVQGSDLAEGLATLEREEARFVVAVTTFPFPIQRALRRSPQGAIEMIKQEHMLTRSQDLEETWHDAGQFYWAKAGDWANSGAGVLAQGAYGTVIERHRVQDIDTEEDWVRAELLMSVLNASMGRKGA